MIPPFRLLRPETLEEALQLAAELGDEARFYAGGTELLLVMREGFIDASHLIDLKHIPELSGVSVDEAGTSLRIGAVTSHALIERSPLVLEAFPELSRLEAAIANLRVRNTGTLGGNLSFAEPHGDPGPLLIAADAVLSLTSPDGSRTVGLAEWVRGPFEADLRPGEILTEVRIPTPRRGSGFGYRRFRALERPTVGVAVRLDLDADGTSIDDVRIVVGCAGPRPARIPAAEAQLRSTPLLSISETVDEAASIASAAVDTDGDAYGPEDYKRHLVSVLVRRATLAAVAASAGTLSA